jgi:hypothetical protein
VPPTTARRLGWGLVLLTAAFVGGVEILLIAGTTDDLVNPSVPTAAVSAALVLAVAFLLPAFVRRLDLEVTGALPWVAGGLSVLLVAVPWLAYGAGRASWAEILWRGVRIPPGLDDFWDISLVLQSVDCASYGFDVYAANNGCMQDPSIYGPGTLWLQYVPFDIFSERNAGWLGLLAVVVSSLVLVWLARISTGRGRLVLLVAAVGAPWLLLLERGNFDAFVIWSAVLLVFLTRRWNALWAWYLGAAGIWLMGTWKYYPFALGLMLLPALRLKHGWTVIVGFALAASAYVVLTWDNLVFSLASNADMPLGDDVVILGRVPLTFRMPGGDPDPWTVHLGDLFIIGAAVAALAWGAVLGGLLRRSFRAQAMLALGGSVLFLTAVLVSGFGFAYKAAFLLLTVPLLALPTRPRDRLLLYSSLATLGMVVLASTVVWNTALSTMAGIVAAAFALGLSGRLVLRSTRGTAGVAQVDS